MFLSKFKSIYPQFTAIEHDAAHFDFFSNRFYLTQIVANREVET